MDPVTGIGAVSGAVTILVAAIQTANIIVALYDDATSLPTEVAWFVEYVKMTREVLQDLKDREECGALHRTRGIISQLEALDDALKSGQEALHKCSKPQKLHVRIFSQAHLRRLHAACAKIQQCLGRISASGATLQIDAIDKMAALDQKIESKLDRYHDEVVEGLMEAICCIQETPQLVVDQLQGLGLVEDRSDCVNQLERVRDDAVEMNRADASWKHYANQDMLEWAVKLSMKDDVSYVDTNATTTRPSDDTGETTVDVGEMLICPISKRLMRDPVILLPSNVTVDRESACGSLLRYHPRRCPVTAQEFDQKLSYVDDMKARRLLVRRFGEGAYQRYDDSSFQEQYERAWHRSRDCTNVTAYEHWESLACAMYCGSVRAEEVQRFICAVPEDAVVEGLKALTFSQLASNTRSVRSERIAQVSWDRAVELGLEACSLNGNDWAQLVWQVHEKPAWDISTVMYYLGLLHENRREYVEAAKCFEKAAERGYNFAWIALGNMFFNGTDDFPANYAKAKECYSQAALQDDSVAWINMGLLYTKGSEDVPRDFAKAKEFFEHALSLGDHDGWVNLGLLYEKGHEDFPKDFGKAKKCYEKGAERGNDTGWFHIGTLYRRGDEGFPRDFAKAKEFYEKEGSPEALFNIAAMYHNGEEGFPKDFAKAKEYYERAAEQGFHKAWSNIGRLYHKGSDAFPKDHEVAKIYCQHAARYGVELKCSCGQTMDTKVHGPNGNPRGSVGCITAPSNTGD